MTTLSFLKDQIEHYDQKRKALLNELGQLSDDQLRKRIGPRKWSLLEIVQHMVLAETYVLQNLPNPNELIDRKRGLREWLSYWLVFFVLRWRIPVPVPSEGMVPDGKPSLRDLQQKWDQNLHWLTSYVASIRPADLTRAVFSHPVTGPLTLAQAGRLAQLHYDAHLKQINKVCAVVNSDSAN